MQKSQSGRELYRHLETGWKDALFGPVSQACRAPISMVDPGWGIVSARDYCLGRSGLAPSGDPQSPGTTCPALQAYRERRRPNRHTSGYRHSYSGSAAISTAARSRGGGGRCSLSIFFSCRTPDHAHNSLPVSGGASTARWAEFIHKIWGFWGGLSEAANTAWHRRRLR